MLCEPHGAPSAGTVGIVGVVGPAALVTRSSAAASSGRPPTASTSRSAIRFPSAAPCMSGWRGSRARRGGPRRRATGTVIGPANA